MQYVYFKSEIVSLWREKYVNSKAMILKQLIYNVRDSQKGFNFDIKK